MEAATTKDTPRKTPGPLFFLGAMALYLVLVQGLSLWLALDGSRLPDLGEHPDIPAMSVAALERYAETLGGSRALHGALIIALLYACMVTVFFLTRRLVGGPVWLGSLAGTAFMANPVKTEIFFETIGLYYILSALFGLLTILAYLSLARKPTVFRYILALGIYAAACFPFMGNAALLGVLFLLEIYPTKYETRQWLRLIPFVGVAMASNWLQLDILYERLPLPNDMLAPLFLIVYPIGLLPETMADLQAQPVFAWAWGIAACLCAGLAFAFVKSGPFRIGLLAILLYRFFPGTEKIDFVTLEGGGQLLLPLALACLALAGLSRWLMGFEAWGRPTVALTTMLCLVLFVLQFQANRAALENTERAVAGPDQSPPVAPSTPENVQHE